MFHEYCAIIHRVTIDSRGWRAGSEEGIDQLTRLLTEIVFDGTVKIDVVEWLIDKKQKKKNNVKGTKFYFYVCIRRCRIYLYLYTYISAGTYVVLQTQYYLLSVAYNCTYIFFFFGWIYRAGGVNNNLTSSSSKKTFTKNNGTGSSSDVVRNSFVSAVDCPQIR